jgi:hypothetical protein
VPANTAAASVIAPRKNLPEERRDGYVINMVLGNALVADQYILDRIDVLKGMYTLEKILQYPARLGVILAVDDADNP